MSEGLPSWRRHHEVSKNHGYYRCFFLKSIANKGNAFNLM
jgi:hypothetical protein